MHTPRWRARAQVLSILEELHDAKAAALQARARRRAAAHGGSSSNGSSSSSSGLAQAAAWGGHGALCSVPEGGGACWGAADSIAAVHTPSDLLPPPHPPAGAAHHHHTTTTAAAAAAAGGAEHGPASGAPATVSAAIAAVASGLEAMLWASPWDAAALTQLLELLLQARSNGAAAEEDFVAWDDGDGCGGGGAPADSRDVPGTTRGARDQRRSGGGSQAGGRSGGSKGSGGGRWWGSLSTAARAALGGGRSGGGGGGGTARGRAAKAGGGGGGRESDVASAALLRERVHKLVVAALDVLLRLTAPPGGARGDSAFTPAARPDLTPAHSLALPLLCHPDTPAALAGCLWGPWGDAAAKAVRCAGAVCVGVVWGMCVCGRGGGGAVRVGAVCALCLRVWVMRACGGLRVCSSLQARARLTHTHDTHTQSHTVTD
jgi:hypothetical protein